MISGGNTQQNEQDAILDWAGTKIGAFVDLGCYDGERFSTTADLADRGWSGICVDAAPDAAAACAVRYAGRDDVSVILGAFAIDEPSMVTIHWSPAAMYSSRKANLRDDITLAPIEMAPLNLGFLAARIQTLTHPLFCSIDLEGSSLEALAWLLEFSRPDCICVEANNPDDRAEVQGWLTDGWDEIPVSEHNLLFVRR